MALYKYYSEEGLDSVFEEEILSPVMRMHPEDRVKALEQVSKTSLEWAKDQREFNHKHGVPDRRED